MLPSLVKHRHDHRDTVSLTADSGDGTLQILVVIVGTHGNFLTEHLVLYAVVEAVGEDVNIPSAHRGVEETLSLARSESGAFCLDHKGSVIVVVSPFLEVIVNLVYKLGAAFHADYTEFAVHTVSHLEYPSLF